MPDLTGQHVVLHLPEDAGDTERLAGAMFKNGDCGTVLKASQSQDEGWIVVMHGIKVLWFTDELRVEAHTEHAEIVVEEAPDARALPDRQPPT